MIEAVPHVDGERLWADLQALGRIGRGDRGITRLAFGPADMEGRRWLCRRMSDAGMHARIDGVGNVIGDLDKAAAGPAITIGSHTDTVPEGGMFDGALGVLAGLEVARSVRDAGISMRHPLRVISFANEEGSRIIPGTFGSRSYVGRVPEEEWARMAPVLAEAGLTGTPERAIAAAGPSGSPSGSSSGSPAGCLCYLELHIEQGGVLDAAGEDVGVVTGIVSITAFTATFKGEANHAGTTPMECRKDALLGAAELVLAIPELVGNVGGPATVGTCGQLNVQPGGRNVIPGEVAVSVEVRDLEEDVAMRVVAGIRETAGRLAGRRSLGLELGNVSATRGAKMHPRLQDLIQRSSQELGLSGRRMPSGAGHDAMNMAAVAPTGMIFVPSKGGISHSPAEWTSKEQCGAGAGVLLRTVLAIDEGFAR